jgi:hypothetical protein
VKRLIALLLVVGLALPPVARAAPPEPITPESTSSARFSVEQEGQQSIAAGDLQGASDLYYTRGYELRDPVLIVASVEQLRDLAKRDRSIPAAQNALERLRVAFDMLYYLRDSSTSAAWQPISSDQVATVIARAERVQTETEALISEIEAEIAAAAAAPPEQKKRGKAKPGTIMIAGGTAALVLGLGAAGLGAGGLAIGAGAQQDVEDPLVYAAEHRAAEQRGRQGNLMAGVGFAIAGVGIVAGATLIVLGVKKRKAAGPSTQAMVPVPIGLNHGAGIGLTGRF